MPATEVGGDYFDYFDYFAIHGRLAIVSGDGTGHGLASGLVRERGAASAAEVAMHSSRTWSASAAEARRRTM